MSEDVKSLVGAVACGLTYIVAAVAAATVLANYSSVIAALFMFVAMYVAVILIVFVAVPTIYTCFFSPNRSDGDDNQRSTVSSYVS